MGYGLANVVAFVNPSMIALGGGVASAGAFIIDHVAPLVEARSTMVPAGSTQIVTATLGNDAGAIGAATMALRGGLSA
jgi:glucokinase